MRALLYLLAGLAGAVHAQDAQLAQISQLRGMSLNEMLEVDISTGTSKFLHQAPAVGQVVTAEDIARLGARTLVDVLESIPGLNIYMYQGAVNSPIVEMRGSFTGSGGHILFLRDGKPLRLLSNSTMPEIFRLPVHFIERIEVVRGPVSALYGADALTGVVNIITGKRPNEAGARIGSDGQRDAWIGRNGAAGPVEWAAAFSYSRNTDRMETLSLPLHASFTQTFQHEYADLDLKLRSGPFSAGIWALNYGKLEHGNLANPRGETTIDTQHRHIDLAYNTDLSPSTQLKAALVHTRFAGFGLGELRQGRPMDFHNGEQRNSADLALTETRFSAHRLRLNFGAVDERRFQLSVLPPGAPAPVTDPRTNHYLSVQDEFAFAPDWELTAGLRADRYSDIGTVRNPRFGLVWNINPRLTTKLLQGDAFRAPTYGNPGAPVLEPERMRNTELAFDYRPNERWHALWSVYHYRASNLSDGPQTVARDGDGSELELGWLATPQLQVNGSLSYVLVTDSQTGLRVPLSPKTSAKLAFNWQAAERWSANLRWEAYWDRLRAATDKRAPLDDFQLVHLTVRHQINRQASLQFGVHNLLNNRSYVPVLGDANGADFQLPERSLSLQLEYRF